MTTYHPPEPAAARAARALAYAAVARDLAIVAAAVTYVADRLT